MKSTKKLVHGPSLDNCAIIPCTNCDQQSVGSHISVKIIKIYLTFELKYRSNAYWKELHKPLHTVRYSGETDDSLATGYDEFFCPVSREICY